VPWIALIAWLAAVVVAIVVLGFCGYELIWKARRVKADLRRLGELGDRVEALQAELMTAQQRATRIGSN
jgi:HAMP domain-containing protein